MSERKVSSEIHGLPNLNMRLFFLSSDLYRFWEVNLPFEELQDLVNESGRDLLASSIDKLETIFTYMTGMLMSSTACHSLQFKGTMEKRPWRKGMYSSKKCSTIDRVIA
jgi:hypothetical protein